MNGRGEGGVEDTFSNTRGNQHTVKNQSSAPVGAGQKRALGVIFSIMLMDVIGISVLSPVAPYIVERYSSEALMVTMITVLYAAAQFLGAPLLGRLGDRYGRRPVLLVSLLGQAAGYFIFGIGGSLGVLFTARLVGGITGGNLSTASAYIADISKPEERSKNFTLIGIAWGMGLILGPALGSVFGQISLEMPAFAAAVLSLLNVLLSILLLPESLPAERRDHTPIRARDFNPIQSIVDMARKPSLGWILLILALFNFAFNGINSTATLFVIQKFSAQTWQVGLMLVLGGVALAVVQFLMVQRLAPRYGEKLVAMGSLFGQAVSSVALFFAPLLWMIFPFYMIANAFSGFTFPTMTTLTTNRVLPHEVGLLMGVTTAIGSLMNIAGPLWAGLVYDAVMPGAPYWMGALVYVVAAFMLVRVKNMAPLQEPLPVMQAAE
jgi:multidrug resistance protein